MSEQPTPMNDYSPPGMPAGDGGNSVAAKRLVRALSDVGAPGTTSTDDIRDATCAFVDELKASFLPPEQVLVQIKQLVALPLGDSRSDEQRQLLQRIITWCIEAYYRR